MPCFHWAVRPSARRVFYPDARKLKQRSLFRIRPFLSDMVFHAGPWMRACLKKPGPRVVKLPVPRKSRAFVKTRPGWKSRFLPAGENLFWKHKLSSMRPEDRMSLRGGRRRSLARHCEASEAGRGNLAGSGAGSPISKLVDSFALVRCAGSQ